MSFNLSEVKKKKFMFLSCFSIMFFPAGAKEGGLFDDPSYVNVDKPRPPVASNGNMHRDAFDMSKCFVFVLC